MRITQPDRHLLIQFVQQNSHLLTGHLLDVGGQDGKRYRRFFSHVTKHTVLDPDESARPDIVAGAEKIPLPDASIDDILSTEVWMDIYPIHDAIREMARVLKSGGYLLATTSFMSPICDAPYHYWRFTPYSLLKLLEPYFEEIHITHRGGYQSVKAQTWIRYRIERWNLYKHPFFGHVFSLLSAIRMHIAIRLDARDTSEINKKYTLGFNIIAKRK